MKFLKRLFCKHDYKFVRNVYGDELIVWDWNRSLWRCKHCEKVEAHPELHEKTHMRIDMGVKNERTDY